MRQIEEKQIAAMAPDASAVSNAKRIVKNGEILSHSRSADDTFYMGRCSGSESSDYTVSLDFIEGDTPVCRCSCPSRQLPCKHSLALMMEMAEDREWEICEIPQVILDKRTKKAAKEGKKDTKKSGETENGGKAKAPKKTNQAARTKKLKKQMEGLDLAERLVKELMEAGLGTLTGTSVKEYQDLTKQLGDYYLPGPQRMVQSLVLEMERLQETGEGDYRNAVDILVFLRALISKSKSYLTEKLENGQVEADNSVLYEELGGVWTLERLMEMGLVKEHARLIQLSFEVYYDKARKEFVDKGWWLDLDSGEINVTFNYRPIKALKYVKEEDSVMDVLQIPHLIYYPGGNGRRVRWEHQDIVKVTPDILKEVRGKAADSLTESIKNSKNELKNTLSDGRYGCLLRFSKIGVEKGETTRYLLYGEESGGGEPETPWQQSIELKDRPGDFPSVNRIELLPDRAMLKNQVMFGVLWYDADSHKICMQPYSIVMEDEIIRMLY